jgi:signal transduction histidine kinase
MTMLSAAPAAVTSLRVRLVAAFAVLVLALAGLGAWSAWRIRDLGAVAERILADNYLSVDAAHRMRVSLERLDAARRAGEDDASSAGGDERPEFERAFRSAAGNITEPGEGEVIAAIADEYARYQRTPTAAGTDSLRRSLGALEALNAAAMQHKSDAAGALAKRDLGWALGLLGGLTLGGAWLTWAVARSVIDPIAALTRGAARISAGDLDVTIPAGRPDELGQMARAFNEMAARVRHARVSDRDALVEARQVAERMMLLEDVRHLHEVNRLKSEFVAEASHELRTPLTSLQLGLNLLLEQAESLSPRQREIVTMCRDDGDRLARLARDLLDLSRLESGRRPPRLAPLATDLLVNGTVEPLRRQADARGVELVVDLPADRPVVHVDRTQIERVLTNLVSNALRATPAGGRVTVSVRDRPDGVAMSVADTGIGIAADQLPRLFEPFVQIGAGTRGGTGLGLAISRRIVQAHGGTIAVQSAPGEGSTFTFTVPRAPVPSEENSDASPDRR